jgi:hypothetical protein
LTDYREVGVTRGLAVAVLMMCSVAVRAQSIRGNVIDGATRAPVPGVLVSMVNTADSTVGLGVRTDSAGNFVVHAPRAGSWRVRTSRIGYAPLTSPPVQLDLGALAILRLQLSATAQALLPVQIVERRQYTAAELMSTEGFDARRERGQGAFLSGERLEKMGVDGLREILGLHLRPRLFVDIDSVVGEVLRMREGARACSPEIHLDGRLLATAPEAPMLIDTMTPQTAMDTMALQLRLASDYNRRMFNQVVALNTLAGLTARDVHGIEVYRANEVPPASLGAWFGMTKTSTLTCGTVAVWTKLGAISPTSTVRPNSMPTKPLQVVSGTLVDYETGLPVSGRLVSLLDENLDEIGQPARTNERGEFVLRTGRSGGVRLRAGDTSYRVSTTPIFKLGANELAVVRLYVSGKTPLIAPLAVASRLFPHSIGATSRAGFTYRRERAQGGVFLRGDSLRTARRASILESLRGVADLTVGDGAEQVTVRAGRQTCRPTFFLDGIPVNPSVATAVSLDNLLGVEVYTRPSIIPVAFGDGSTCAAIIVWTNGGTNASSRG